MKPVSLNGGVKSMAAALITGGLLLATLLAAMGAGPDEPVASNVNNDWEVFEGHVYAGNQAAPSGISVVACLGGCEEGYATAPVTTGWDGIYRVKIEPGVALPEGRMVTFWLVNGSERVESAQDVLFRGDGEVRTLDLNFDTLPPEPVNDGLGKDVAGNDASGNEASGDTVSDKDVLSNDASGNETSGNTVSGKDVSVSEATGAKPVGTATRLSVPAAGKAGLTPGTPQSYVGSVRYSGMPLLPGFVALLGLLLAAIGASLLVYRRRAAW